MKKTCCGVFALGFATVCSSIAQIDPAAYFPMTVGNKWNYYEAQTTNEIVVAQIILEPSFRINDKVYYSFPGFWWGHDTLSAVTNGKVYYLFQGQDQLFYNLSAGVGENWNFTLSLLVGQPTMFVATLESRTDTVIVPAGTFTNCIRIHIRAPGYSFTRIDWLAPNIGLVYRGTGIPSWLRSALVNGMQYPGVTGIEENRFVSRFELGQNFPNPFSAGGGSAYGGNPTTTISYHLPARLPSGQAGQAGLSAVGLVTLKVFDALGREVSTLLNEIDQPGIHKVQWDGSGLPSGIYFYRLQAGEYVETKKMILLR